MKVSSIGLVRTLSAVSAFSLVMCVGCSGEDGGSESTSNPIDSGTETTTPGSDAGSPEDAEVPSDGPIPQDASPPDAPVEDGGPDQDGYVPYEPPCGNTNPTKAIGNWDVVPGQSFDGAFEVGVVAFHEYGVDVTFSVNGNVLATVKNPWLNPRTGAFEYFVTLKASDYPDGPITLNATITPDCSGHQARELQELVLYANAGGTQTNSTVKWVDCATGSDSSGNGTQGSPYETIEKAIVEVGAGGTVYLAAGTQGKRI